MPNCFLKNHSAHSLLRSWSAFFFSLCTCDKALLILDAIESSSLVVAVTVRDSRELPRAPVEPATAVTCTRLPPSVLVSGVNARLYPMLTETLRVRM